MQRDLRAYLADVQQSIGDITQFIGGKSFSDYESDLLTRRAVEREFTILAEALNCIGRISPDLHHRVEYVREIAGFRNILIHAYHVVDDALVWNVATTSLVLLKQQLDSWAEELDRAAE